MRSRLKIISCLAVAAAAGFGSADTVLRSRSLADLTKASSTSTFTRSNCDFVSLSTDSSGSPVATLRFKGHYASFGQDLSTSQDWSSYNLVQARVKNKESHTVSFRFIVQLTSDPNNYTGAFTGLFTLAPGESKLFMFNLNQDSAEPYGMEYLRPVLTQPYTDVVAYSSFRNLKTIYHWRVSLQDTVAASLSISELKLLRQNLVFDGIADKYGQYTDRSWSDKINQDSDFQARKAAELTDLSANPGTGETQGSKSLVNPSITPGIWKVVRNSSGKMYLQHPSGKLFWSMGLSAVGEGAATPVEGRENMFQSLPSSTGSFAGAYIDRPTPDGTLMCFNFAQRNLMAKYGTDYKASWLDTVRKRISSWGVNTLGIDSTTSLFGQGIPYTLLLHTNAFGTRFRPPHLQWGSLPDPYTDGFQTWMTTEFTEQLAPYLTHWSFMGVFVDNEMSWGNMASTTDQLNIARGALNATSTQPGKTAFMNQLKTKYNGSISALNTAWGTKYTSWSDFLATRWLPTSFPSALKTDGLNFVKAFAETYYSKVNLALSAAGLKALYLGSRYEDWTPEVVSAASKYVDVLSFNLYRTVDNVDWDYLNSLSKPVLISELGYGAKSDGTFGGPAPTYSSESRAERLKALLNKAITVNNIVGVHWYSYVDQPITGRWSDYQNTGLGLVDIADNPYMDSVEVLRNFTKTMYAVRG